MDLRTLAPPPPRSLDADAGSRGAAPDTGRRLARAVLGYLVVTTLLVTWAPFSFALPDAYELTRVWSLSDLVLNVIMFLPLGFLWQASREGRGGWWKAGLLGVAFSSGIEIGQLFLVDRLTSTLDVATNGLGAALGAALFVAARPGLALRSGRVSALALDLPLTGLILLLIPLLWAHGFASGGQMRSWLMLLPLAFGGVLLGVVHGGYLAPRTPHPPGSRPLQGVGWLPAATLLWVVVAAFPGALRSPLVLLVGGVGALLAAAAGHAGSRAWRSVEGSGAGAAGERRVELPMLRLALPLLAVYLVLSALWPLTRPTGAWNGGWIGGWTLAPASDTLTLALTMRTLEYLGALTLVGYVTAEFHGRANAPFRSAVVRVLTLILPLVVLLEGARGWNPALGSSYTVGVLAAGAGVFGGWLYHLQRDHIVRLLGSGPRLTDPG